MDTEHMRVSAARLIAWAGEDLALQNIGKTLQSAADHIDRLTSELDGLRKDHVAMVDKAAAKCVRLEAELEAAKAGLRLVTIGMAESEWAAAQCNIPESERDALRYERCAGEAQAPPSAWPMMP